MNFAKVNLRSIPLFVTSVLKRRTLRLSVTLPVTLQSFTHSIRFNSADVRVRFAPSPTGNLHLGGLRTALYNYLFAKGQNGKFILRIEDTDQTRLVPGAAKHILDVLDWAGLKPDEGPDVGGDHGPYYQSQRLDLYHKHTEQLLSSGHAYRCFCSESRLALLRREAASRRENIKYDNRCRHLGKDQIEEKLSRGDPFTVRFKMNAELLPWIDKVYGEIKTNVAELEGDPILLKSDGFPTYHLANVIDDHHMQISHVLRGWEWQVSTEKHIKLFHAFGWTPPTYAHLPLLLNSDGTKLSKRQQDITVQHFIEQGYYPESIISLITSTGAGFSPPIREDEVREIEHLVQSFRVDCLVTYSSRLQLDRVNVYNQLALQNRLKSPSHLTQLLQELREKVVGEFSWEDQDESYILSDQRLEFILLWSQSRISIVTELWESPEYRFLWKRPAPVGLSLLETRMVVDEQMLDALKFAAAAISGDSRQLMRSVKKYALDKNLRWQQIMRFIRLAITGSESGPPVVELIELVGREEASVRAYTSIHFLELQLNQRAISTDKNLWLEVVYRI